MEVDEEAPYRNIVRQSLDLVETELRKVMHPIIDESFAGEIPDEFFNNSGDRLELSTMLEFLIQAQESKDSRSKNPRDRKRLLPEGKEIRKPFRSRTLRGYALTVKRAIRNDTFHSGRASRFKTASDIRNMVVFLEELQRKEAASRLTEIHDALVRGGLHEPKEFPLSAPTPILQTKTATFAEPVRNAKEPVADTASPDTKVASEHPAERPAARSAQAQPGKISLSKHASNKAPRWTSPTPDSKPVDVGTSAPSNQTEHKTTTKEGTPIKGASPIKSTATPATGRSEVPTTKGSSPPEPQVRAVTPQEAARGVLGRARGEDASRLSFLFDLLIMQTMRPWADRLRKHVEAAGALTEAPPTLRTSEFSLGYVFPVHAASGTSPDATLSVAPSPGKLWFPVCRVTVEVLDFDPVMLLGFYEYLRRTGKAKEAEDLLIGKYGRGMGFSPLKALKGRSQPVNRYELLLDAKLEVRVKVEPCSDIPELRSVATRFAALDLAERYRRQGVGFFATYVYFP